MKLIIFYLATIAVGLELGILSPRLFTMQVIMAVVTTFMTGPILSLLERQKMRYD